MKGNNDTPAAHSLTLGVRGYTANIFQGILKGVPYIGSALEQFIYGPAAELRLRRIELTLSEVAARLSDDARKSFEPNEEFVSLLERVVEPLGKTTTDDSRSHFRQLLLNGAQLEPRSRRWSEANLAANLLASIEDPGLAIVAALGRQTDCALNEREDPLRLSVVSLPEPQVFVGTFSFDEPVLQYPLGYTWPVIEEWLIRLSEHRLVGRGTRSARGGFTDVTVTDIGRLLVRWTVESDAPAT